MAKKVFRTELNPVDLLERAAFVYPNKVALVHGERRYSYAALGERAWRLANALRDVGLEQHGRLYGEMNAHLREKGVEWESRSASASTP